MNPAEIVNKMYSHDGFSQWLGIQVDHISAGKCELSMTVTKEMLNGFGIAHGAIAYALADSALAFASNSHGRQSLSVDTSINHLEAAAEGAKLVAKATEVSLKNKFGLYSVEVRKGDKLIAVFKGTVYRTEKEWTP
ncbi:MAG: hotdog fold thioesterase [Bacteroidia bacterium]